MRLPLFGVRWPVTTSMLFLAVILLGGFAYTRVGLDLMPDFEVPVITVITTYSGAGPEEVETGITEIIEGRVSTVQNVDEVMSTSSEGVSMVTIKFAWGTDLAEATNEIRDKLDLASKYLPENAERPAIFKFNVSMIPVLMLGVTANESWGRLDRIVDKKVVDPLKRISGVATAVTRGGDRRGILCQVDRERIRAVGLEGRDVLQALLAQNIDNPGGRLRVGLFDYLIRTPGVFTSVDQIGDVIISRSPGIVRLRDIADVKDGFLEKTNEFLINGQRAIGVLVQKQSGTNSVAVSQAILEALPAIQAELPADVKVHVLFDTADFIRSTIRGLQSAVLIGGIGVFLVILFFLGDLRASLIVCTTIPTSLIITFLLMYLAGYTINQISLSSLAIGIGMVVDNAIVILDNIKRFLERGLASRPSAVQGAAEMGTAVLASTLTTIVIFLPIIFTSGITQIMFGQLAAIVVMALTASLFSALMLTPMLCSKFLLPTVPASTPGTEPQRWFGARMLDTLEDRYAGILSWSLARRHAILIALLIGFGASLGAIRLLGTDFIPEQDQGHCIIHVELPTGTRYEVTGQVMDQAQKIILSRTPELKSMVGRYGVSNDALARVILGLDEASHTGVIELFLVPKDRRQRGLRHIIEDLRTELEKIPGALIRFDASDPLARMIGATEGNFSMNLYGHDLSTGITFAQTMVAALSAVPGLKDLKISQQLAQPELQIEVDREKASSLGLDLKTIGTAVEGAFQGNTTAKFREGGEEYDIEIRLRERDRQTIDDLAQTPVGVPMGGLVRLDTVARVVQRFGPTRIERNEQERCIRISGQIVNRGSGDVARDAEHILASLPIPPGFTWKFSGSEKERRASFFLMFQAAVLGMILVYMVMASQFESLVAPFLIFLSIPFGFMGAILTLVMTGFRVSIVSLLGFIILIGIVVNNGIVLISYINTLIGRGQSVHEALLAAGRSRLRPVLATSLTTMLGMTPMALSTGEGSEIWVPLAVSVIGGLGISTIMTLIVMPLLYFILQRHLIPEAGGDLDEKALTGAD
jgi:hydrophobe/amphiphile efflux-1 (HAE1) family protein